MHRDASGLLHVRAVVFGPWSAAHAERRRRVVLAPRFLLPERAGKRFDHVPYDGDVHHHTPQELCARLGTGERPFVTTRAWDGTGVTETFALLVRALTGA